MPLVGQAQQPVMPVIGFLSTTTPGPFAHLIAGFRRGLQEVGYLDGRNVVIEYRWAEGHYDRVQALALDLVQRQMAVIVTTGGETSAVAAKAATTTIPIVFNTGTDPVRLGLVASLARPGGNATGVNIFNLPVGYGSGLKMAVGRLSGDVSPRATVGASRVIFQHHAL